MDSQRLLLFAGSTSHTPFSIYLHLSWAQVLTLAYSARLTFGYVLSIIFCQELISDAPRLRLNNYVASPQSIFKPLRVAAILFATILIFFDCEEHLNCFDTSSIVISIHF